MRFVKLVFALVPLLAIHAQRAGRLSNAVTIEELSGSAQPNRPFTISRVFAEGEIPHYPQPFVGGTPLSPWQADIKTRWRDGQAECSIVNVSNTSPITVTCSNNHGYLYGDSVKIRGIIGNTVANGAWTIRPTSPVAFTLLNSKGNATYSGGGTATGPAYGSVRHALISFNVSLVAKSKTGVVFVDSTNPCSSGEATACAAASLTTTQAMLAPTWMNGASPWAAGMDLTNGNTKVTDVRAMLALLSINTSQVRYWLQGPVVTEAIVEDRSPARSFDTGIFAAGKSIHPMFVLDVLQRLAGSKSSVHRRELLGGQCHR